MASRVDGHGIAYPIAPGAWAIDVSLAEYDVRGALLVGAHRAVVWDTLSHPRDMAPWLTLAGGRAITVVYSHADWDHVWGTCGLPGAGLTIVAHEACLARFAGDVPRTLAEKRQAEPGAWDEVRLVPPTLGFTRDLTIDLGGLTLELHHLPGHTPDCIVGIVPELGVLLTGDTMETPCPVVPADSPLAAWVDGLRRWARDDRVRLVVPAHGRTGGREIADENVAYLTALLEGAPREPAGPLTGFYAATHRQNLAWRPTGTSGRAG